jgi:Kef-type K+ transport system membrane component KefB
MEGAELSHLVTGIIFQLCIILVAAKIAGEVSQRYLKIPTVLGELAAGIKDWPLCPWRGRDR